MLYERVYALQLCLDGLQHAVIVGLEPTESGRDAPRIVKEIGRTGQPSR